MSISKTLINEATVWRRTLHAAPELGFQELKTSDKVAGLLSEFGIEVHRGLGGTGVVGTLRNGDGPTIGIRADMDALPIQELGDSGHKSAHKGVHAALTAIRRFCSPPPGTCRKPSGFAARCTLSSSLPKKTLAARSA